MKIYHFKFTLFFLPIFFLFNISFAQTTNFCPNLKYYQAYGSRDSRNGGETSRLQKFLKQNLQLTDQQFLVTGVFGRITTEFVKQFQENNNLVISGQVGAITRNKIAQVCNQNSVQNIPTNNTTNTTTKPLWCVPVPTGCTAIGRTIVNCGNLDCSNLNKNTNTNTNYNTYNQILNCTPVPEGCNAIDRTTTSCGTISCANTISCTPLSPQTQTFACSSNQTGTIIQTRTSSCSAGATSPSWSAWINTSNTCTNVVTTPTNQSCTLDGLTISHNNSQSFSTNRTVPYGQTCQTQSRTCNNGVFSGSSVYQYANCTVDQPAVTYSWTTGNYGTCTNSLQTRSVTCVSYNNQTVSDSFCTSLKPTTTQACTIIPSEPLSITLTVNGKEGEVSVSPGASFILAWSSASATSCAASSYILNGRSDHWNVTPNASSSYRGIFSAPLWNLLSYTLTCSNSTGQTLSKTVTMKGHIKYFGYYGVFPDVSVVADHANLAQVNTFDFAKMDAGSTLKIKSYVSNVYRNLFHGSCDRIRALDNWNTYANSLQPYVQRDDIAAIYLMDEPYSHLSVAPYNCSRDQITARLQDAASVIKTRFPTLLISIVEGPIKDFETIQYPNNIDWVGFDCYPNFQYTGATSSGNFDSCGPYGISVKKYIDILKSRLSMNQSIVLIPEAFYISIGNAVAPTQETQQKIASLGKQFLELAFSEPRIVAVMPYLGLHRTVNTSAYFGALEMPPVKSVYTNFGKAVRSPSSAQ